MFPSPVLAAQSTDLLGRLAQGGTGALIVALCVALWWFSRRTELLHAQNLELHEKHAALLTKQIEREAESKREVMAVVDRYNEIVANLNDARLEELRRVGDALRRSEGESAEDAPAQPPRARRKSGGAS